MEHTTKRSRLPAREISSMPNLNLTVVYHRIDTLKLDPVNPRVHSKRQIRQFANNITKFGFNVPILVDAERKVIAGHGRLLACGELGIAEVPTLRLDHLTPAQARAFAIADNRLTEIASWDDRLLAEQLKELSLLDLDFSLELTGFEMGEIDLRIASLEDASDPADDPADPCFQQRHSASTEICGCSGPSSVVWQCPRPGRFHTSDGRGARCYGFYRSSLQRCD